MNIRLFLKIAATLVVAVLLLIPVEQIRALVNEREQTRDSVVQEIARSAGYAQTITGPLLIVPYTRKVRSWSQEGEERERRLVETEVFGRLAILPTDFELSGDIPIEERQRGIYRARLFNADTRITGRFQIEPDYGIPTEQLADYTFDSPRLVLGISDTRGIGSALELRWNGKRIPFEPGALPPMLPSGVHAQLPMEGVTSDQSVAFSIGLSLQGTSDLQVTPVGRESRVMFTSNWPHPSFVGDILPQEREVSDAGFSARWQTSFFATNLENIVNACAEIAPDSPGCADLATRRFGVSFIDPIDHYLKSERATKYAFLFIGLTFAVFFLFEVLRRLSVHPIQYGLVGMALAVFFLLLLSFSEHFGFARAYLISAFACVALVGYYVAHVVRDARLGVAFGAGLGALYGVLYTILSAEDYALLAGSLVVFAVLGAIMVLTRKVNWTNYGQASEAIPRPASVTDGKPAA